MKPILKIFLVLSIVCSICSLTEVLQVKAEENLILEFSQPAPLEYVARIDNTYYTTLEEAITASVNGDTIYLLNNIIQNTTLTLEKTLTFQSESGDLYQIKRGNSLIKKSLLQIASGGDVTIKDICLDGGAEWDEEGSKGYINLGIKADAPLVTVIGKLTMENGAVLTNNDIYHTGNPYSEGSGVFVEQEGTFIMFGGEITENAIGGTYGFGAGLYNHGTVELRGGRISYNTLHVSQHAYGGGIYNNGTLNIYNGEISSNIGSTNGGGIYSGRSFTMYGGKISKNIVTTMQGDAYGGGGILIYGSENTFTMEGGEISDNIVTNHNGGGISAYYANFTMKDGVIKDNIAKESGGGVWVHYSTSNSIMTEGNIIHNIAQKYGGGIYMTNGSQLYLTGGEISNNSALSGGGIYNWLSKIDYKYAPIKNNLAETGGGITLYSGSLNMTKTVDISENSNGDIYQHVQESKVILKENITVLKPIGILVNSSFHEGSTVIDGNSYSIHANLEDFYYTGSGYTLAKNGYDIVLEGLCHVTYQENGATEGSVPTDNNDYQSGETVTVKDSNGTLQKIGNRFSGWNTSADGTGTTYTVGDTFIITKDMILYALWTKDNIETFPVIYDANGADFGNVPINHTNYRRGAKVNVFNNTGNLKKDGHIWNGWNTNADGNGTTYKGGNQFYIHEATTLYAQWEVNSYTLTYDSNGAESGVVPESKTYRYGEMVLTKDNIGSLQKAGKKYSGWNTNPDGSGDTYTVGDEILLSGNITLYALWTEEGIPTFTVSYHSNQAESGTIPVNETHYRNGEQVNVFGNTGNLTRANYIYVGWNTQSDGMGTSYIERDKFFISENVILYADWQAESEQAYTITYNANGAKNGTVPSDNTKYSRNDIATIYDNIGNLSREGYSFKGWNTQEDGLGTSYKAKEQILITESIILYAIWEIELPSIQYYTVTYNANVGIADKTSDIIEAGGNIILPNAIREGYSFLGWHIQSDSEHIVGTAGNLYEPVGNIILYAKWKIEDITLENFIVTYDANGGIVSQTTVSVINGNSIILPSATRKEYDFIGWYADKERTDSLIGRADDTYIPTENIILYALWEISTPIIETKWHTIIYDGNGGTVTRTKDVVEENESILLPDVLLKGYIFRGWYTIENDLIGKAGEVYQPFSNITLIAKWEKESSSNEDSDKNIAGNENKPEDTTPNINNSNDNESDNQNQKEDHLDNTKQNQNEVTDQETNIIQDIETDQEANIGQNLETDQEANTGQDVEINQEINIIQDIETDQETIIGQDLETDQETNIGQDVAIIQELIDDVNNNIIADTNIVQTGYQNTQSTFIVLFLLGTVMFLGNAYIQKKKAG